MKQKVTEKTQSGGRLEIFEDQKNAFFLARPHGIINPSLLKEDLERARGFANKVNRSWSYITNTEDIWLVNPFNLMYLKEVKKIKKLKQIVVFAPSLINRTLIKLASFIVRPDRIIKDADEFNRFMRKVH